MALKRVFLSNGNEACRAVDFTCRCVNYLFNTEFTSSLYNIECTLDIGINISVWRMVGIGNCYKCCQVKYYVAPLYSSSNTVWVTNITRENIERLLYVIARMIKPTPGVEGIV